MKLVIMLKQITQNYYEQLQNDKKSQAKKNFHKYLLENDHHGFQANLGTFSDCLVQERYIKSHSEKINQIYALQQEMVCELVEDLFKIFKKESQIKNWLTSYGKNLYEAMSNIICDLIPQISVECRKIYRVETVFIDAIVYKIFNNELAAYSLWTFHELNIGTINYIIKNLDATALNCAICDIKILIDNFNADVYQMLRRVEPLDPNIILRFNDIIDINEITLDETTNQQNTSSIDFITIEINRSFPHLSDGDEIPCNSSNNLTDTSLSLNTSSNSLMFENIDYNIVPAINAELLGSGANQFLL